MMALLPAFMPAFIYIYIYSTKKKTSKATPAPQKVPERRLELLQVLPHRLLRPACLPISPPGQGLNNNELLLVPGTRFELVHLLAPPPQDGASTNFATRALWAAKVVNLTTVILFPHNNPLLFCTLLPSPALEMCSLSLHQCLISFTIHSAHLLAHCGLQVHAVPKTRSI